MDRKKTILIAVMMNAGLLVLLFIGALLKGDDSLPVEMAQKQSSTKDSVPLFSHEADMALQPQVAPAPVIHIPVSLKPVEVVPEITHKLPQPAVEPIAVAPVAELKTSRVEVTVKKGDSLDKIAKAHHTTADEIIKLNQLPGSFLKVGQVLKLPDQKLVATAFKPKPAPEKTVAMGPEYYTVKVGDNPWGIAMKHHMKVEELLKLNSLNEERARKLKPGDRLRIR